MTFEQLFEKMNKADREAAAIIVEDWIYQMKKNENAKWLYFNKTDGFLWGMYGAGFISYADKEDLYNILKQITKNKE